MDAVTLALIKSMAGNGGGLPPVTASDNGKVLAVEDGAWAAGAQEYWIPVTTSGSVLVIPSDKAIIVSRALQNPDEYFVRGIVVDGTTYLAGYVENYNSFIVPIDKSTMSIFFGFDCAGKIHVEDDGGYVVKVVPDKFVVTLTPTALDYSGTMDKTVAEINTAYEAGQEIVFKLQTNAHAYIEVPVQLVGHDTTRTYPSFETSVVQSDNNIQVFAHTGVTDDATRQTYFTKIYSLTPAS